MLVEGKKIVAVGPNLPVARRHADRRHRPHRHAGLHRYAPPPVRDGAAQLPRRRGAHQRWVGLAEREHHLLRIHSADVRPRVPSAGRVHQRAVRGLEPARRRRHDGARRLADPSLAPALGRRHPGTVRYRAPRRLRLFRERGCRYYRQQSRQPISERRDPHQEAVVLLERPARHHDHGRRGLSSGLREGLDDRAPARPPDCGAYPLAVRHSPDARPARPRPGRRQRYARTRTRQPVHPHDRDVRPGLAGGQGRRRAGLARRPDRDEHAPRHAADPQDAKSGHGAVAERGRGVHVDGGLLHPDALDHEYAAHAGEPDGPRAGEFPAPTAAQQLDWPTPARHRRPC